MKHHFHPDNLERYSFMWSEARLMIAAVALLIGGTPPLYLMTHEYVVSTLVLKICWFITGAASLYLIYRWMNINNTLFGKKDSLDTFAFFVLAVSGINLGVTDFVGYNVGMAISSNHYLFTIVGLLYLWTAYYLWNRWNKTGRKIF